MSDISKNILYLRNIELFKGFNNEELHEIAEILYERTYPPNTVIVKEGTPGKAMFLIKEGQVDVKKKEPSLGIEMTIATLKSGDCFGEMSLLTDSQRSATVQGANQLTEVMILEKKDFITFLQKHPKMSLMLNRILAQRIEDMNAQKGLGFISLSRLKLDEDLLSLIPQQVITKQRVLPISYSGNTLTLGMVNPHDLPALDEVRRFVKGVAIEPVIITEDDLKKFLKDEYPAIIKKTSKDRNEISKDTLLDAMDVIQPDLLKDIQVMDESEEDNITDLRREAEEAPMIRLANNIIAIALKKGASDIHIEPMEKALRVRYRIDGILQEGHTLPKKVQLPLISRIKIISKLDITERRLPQDGRITIKSDEKSVDFRVSTIPTKFGEKIAIRILDKGGITFSLDRFITDEPTLKAVRDMIKKPYGIIYVTGPTGSGKTTTLYSALSELNNIGSNISTVEDPIEYELPGINQVMVKTDIGMTFAAALRSMLRQAPNIIMIGEIRDAETANIAINASLTGHLVFSTLHTNDAPSAVARLADIGVKPFLIASAVRAVLAQRLVRKLCPLCKTPTDLSDKEMRALSMDTSRMAEATVFGPVGCDKCRNNGYKGRMGIFELFLVDDEVRQMINTGLTTTQLRRRARELGMRTLREDGIRKVLSGLTSGGEVVHVTMSDAD